MSSCYDVKEQSGKSPSESIYSARRNARGMMAHHVADGVYVNPCHSFYRALSHEQRTKRDEKCVRVSHSDKAGRVTSQANEVHNAQENTLSWEGGGARKRKNYA